MMLETLAGNATLKKDLAQALAQHRLAHSVLLCGETGCGAGYAAHCLAADFLAPQGGTTAAAVMRDEAGECLVLKGTGASGNIKVEDVRDARKEIFSTALDGDSRVVLVPHAEKLNGNQGESANALLKVIEEPPENVLFIFTAPSDAVVLPTIRSRCATYTVAPVAVAECAAYLQKEFPRAKDAPQVAAKLGGNIGLAREVLESKAQANILADAEVLCAAGRAKDADGALCLLAKYEQEKEKVPALLRYAAALLQAQLGLGSTQSAQMLRAVLDTRSALLGGSAYLRVKLCRLALRITA